MATFSRSHTFALDRIDVLGSQVFVTDVHGRRKHLGTKAGLLDAIRREPAPSVRELLLWAARAVRESDANLDNLGAVSNKDITLTITLEIADRGV